MKRPSLTLAVEFNRAVRQSDEWFDEPEDLDRVDGALKSVNGLDDPRHAAAVLACRVTRAQGFAEGNKRTALLLARWLLDKNGLDGVRILPPNDRQVADLLIQAAAGSDVEDELISIFAGRST